MNEEVKFHLKNLYTIINFIDHISRRCEVCKQKVSDDVYSVWYPQLAEPLLCGINKCKNEKENER